VLINQPIEKVFEFVATPENDEQWLIGVKARKTSEGPTGVGATSETEVRFLGKLIKTTFEVTEYKPPRKIAVKTVSGPVTMESEETLESTGDSQTKITVHGKAHASGLFRLAEPIIERMAQRQWETSYENLKDLLEAHG
jgi:uncharacterized protein YndB with AHSA1/START domain